MTTKCRSFVPPLALLAGLLAAVPALAGYEPQFTYKCGEETLDRSSDGQCNLAAQIIGKNGVLDCEKFEKFDCVGETKLVGDDGLSFFGQFTHGNWVGEVRRFTRDTRAHDTCAQVSAPGSALQPDGRFTTPGCEAEWAAFVYPGKVASTGPAPKKPVASSSGNTNPTGSRSAKPQVRASRTEATQEKPILTITAANAAQHASKLALGHMAMFKKYPGYKMNIYKNTAGYNFPDWWVKAGQKNVGVSRFEGGDITKLTGASLGVPFPDPKTGAEAIWNHLLRWKGGAYSMTYDQVIMNGGGKEVSRLFEHFLDHYANPQQSQMIESDDTILSNVRTEVLSPRNYAGIISTIRQKRSSKVGFFWDIKRMHRDPMDYDVVVGGTDGQQLRDQQDMYRGALDRYDWKYIGRKVLYLPYASEQLRFATSLSDILDSNHLNQDRVRYEMRNALIVESGLRAGSRHQFKARRFYIDEASWQVLAVDCYDNRENLWKFQEAHTVYLPEKQVQWTVAATIYDLQSGHYFVDRLINETGEPDFNPTLTDQHWTAKPLNQ